MQNLRYLFWSGQQFVPQQQIKLNSLLLFCIASSIGVCFFVGCSAGSQKSIHYFDEKYKIKGSFQMSEELKNSTDIKGYLISKNGVREVADSFSFQLQTGEFEFTARRNQIFKSVGQSLSEQIALMGVRPLDAVLRNGILGNADVGVFRFELFPDAASSFNIPTTAYFQSYLPLPRVSSYGTAQTVRLTPARAGGLKTYPVGKVLAKILSKSGAPIENADVLIVPLDFSKQSLGFALPLLPWKNPEYSPVFVKSNKMGQAILFPVPMNVDESKFQVVASAPGYCFGSTPQTLFVAGNVNEITLKLDECNEEKKNQKNSEFSAEFGEGVNVTTDSESGLKKAFTNGNSLQLKFSAFTPILRGFEIKLFAGKKPSSKSLYELKLYTFASSHNLTLPTYLDEGGVKDGTFLVEIKSLYSEYDRENYGESPKVQMLGVRSSEVPQVDAQDFKVTNEFNSENLISGKADSEFKIVYAKCNTNTQIGVAAGSEYDKKNIKFFPCDASGTFLKFSELKSLFSEYGGFQSFSFFVKNQYGTLNVDDSLNKTNKKQVYIDFGKPESSNLTALSNFGFAPKNIKPGADLSSAYSFTSAGHEVVLRPNNFEQYGFLFSYLGDCVAGASDSDKDGTLDDAKTISRFILMPNQNSASASQWKEISTLCSDSRQLKNGDIIFPTDSAANAKYYFQVADKAGNKSDVIEKLIPPCTGGQALCWQN